MPCCAGEQAPGGAGEDRAGWRSCLPQAAVATQAAVLVVLCAYPHAPGQLHACMLLTGPNACMHLLDCMLATQLRPLLSVLFLYQQLSLWMRLGPVPCTRRALSWAKYMMTLCMCYAVCYALSQGAKPQMKGKVA